MPRNFRPRVSILSSQKKGEYRCHVRGKVHPRQQTVQVFVKSYDDGKWYKQAPVNRRGTSWDCCIVLGLDSCTSIGNVFEVVAIVDPHITENVLNELPELKIHSHSHFIIRT